LKQNKIFILKRNSRTSKKRCVGFVEDLVWEYWVCVLWDVVAKIKINVVAISNVLPMYHKINAIKIMAILIIINNSKTMAIMVITIIINNNSRHKFVNIRYFF
jgi:hypothetical protein